MLKDLSFPPSLSRGCFHFEGDCRDYQTPSLALCSLPVVVVDISQLRPYHKLATADLLVSCQSP